MLLYVGKIVLKLLIVEVGSEVSLTIDFVFEAVIFMVIYPLAIHLNIRLEFLPMSMKSVGDNPLVLYDVVNFHCHFVEVPRRCCTEKCVARLPIKPKDAILFVLCVLEAYLFRVQHYFWNNVL